MKAKWAALIRSGIMHARWQDDRTTAALFNYVLLSNKVGRVWVAAYSRERSRIDNGPRMARWLRGRGDRLFAN